MLSGSFALHRREHRRFLATWALVFAALAGSMTGLTLHFGPDPHLPATHYIGCTIPAALWAGCLLVCILSCYTTDYIRHDVSLLANAPLQLHCPTSAQSWERRRQLHLFAVSSDAASVMRNAGARTYLPSRSCGNALYMIRKRASMYSRNRPMCQSCTLRRSEP